MRHRDPAGRDGATRRGDLLLLALTAAGLVLFYVALFPIKGIRVPAWSDAQSYIWWTRRAGTLGLRAFGTGSRPATVATLATLSATLRLPAEAIVEAIGPVLAAVVGLAAAALSDSLLGPDRRRFVLAAVLCGTFVSQLAIGFDATLVFAALFLAGLAYLSEGLGASRRMPFVTASVLLGVATLAHPVFGVMEAGLLVVGILGVEVWRRRHPAVGSGRTIGLVAVVVLAGAIVAVGLLVARSAPGPPLDTSADTVLRRLGLWTLLRVGWRETLVSSLAILGPTALVAALALARQHDRHWATSPARAWLFAGVGAAWIAGTAAAIPMLLLGMSVPAQRFVTLCLPLPLIIAAGITGRPSARHPRAAALLLLASIAGIAFLVPRYWVAWEAQRGESSRAVVAAHAMGSALARQPAGTPLVLIDDDQRGLPALFTITGHAGYLRDAVPSARVPDVYLFVGSVRDFLAGRPTLSGDVSRDRLATDYWNRLRPALDRPALVVAAFRFDQVAYQDALALPGHVTLAPGVIALPGFTGANGGPVPSAPALTSPGAGPLSPWVPVGVAPLIILIFGIVGWPWVASTLPGRGRIGLALSPAVGLAAIAIAAIVTDAVGIRLQGWTGFVPVVAALGGGLAMLARSRRRGDGGERPASIGARAIPASSHVTDIARTASP